MVQQRIKLVFSRCVVTVSLFLCCEQTVIISEKKTVRKCGISNADTERQVQDQKTASSNEGYSAPVPAGTYPARSKARTTEAI